MRYLYTILFFLLIPFIFIRLFLKSLSQPAYRKHWGQRLGWVSVSLEKCIWVHAVSVGETIAAIPLIKALKIQYPDLPLVVTTMTPTGAERVKAAFADTVIHLYIPYDLPFALQRFLKKIRPIVCIIMETELWPNLLAACKRNKIPVCLVNARLSAKSAQHYQRIPVLTKTMLNAITMIAAQAQADAQRFMALGAFAQQVQVTGNLKFDIELPQDLPTRITHLRNQLGKDRFIWIAASTHEGEETVILAAHKKIREQYDNALLILVPRHPNRFASVAALAQQFFTLSRLSLLQAVTAETAVYLGDTMGELLLLYGSADLAFVGGSLIARGGHNMLEPAALAKPIISGEHVFNFTAISELLLAENALTIVSDADSLAEKVIFFASNNHAREQAGKQALQVVLNNRGALAKQKQIIETIIHCSLVSE